MRVLVANERRAELDALTRAAEHLGAEVVAQELNVGQVASAARATSPDVALVGLPPGEDPGHALALIGELVEGAPCPVVTITQTDDSDFLAGAADLGVYGHSTRMDPASLRAVIDVAIRRFRDHADLALTLERRKQIERAKGIIMERYDIDERAAFEMLRSHARRSNLRLSVAAQHVLDGFRALPTPHHR